MDYISTKEAVKKWGLIHKLCKGNRIPGVIRFSRVWAIPKDTEKSIDARLKSERKND